MVVNNANLLEKNSPLDSSKKDKKDSVRKDGEKKEPVKKDTTKKDSIRKEGEKKDTIKRDTTKKGGEGDLKLTKDQSEKLRLCEQSYKECMKQASERIRAVYNGEKATVNSQIERLLAELKTLSEKDREKRAAIKKQIEDLKKTLPSEQAQKEKLKIENEKCKRSLIECAKGVLTPEQFAKWMAMKKF